MDDYAEVTNCYYNTDCVGNDDNEGGVGTATTTDWLTLATLWGEKKTIYNEAASAQWNYDLKLKSANGLPLPKRRYVSRNMNGDNQPDVYYDSRVLMKTRESFFCGEENADGAVEGSMLKDMMDQTGLFDSLGTGELSEEQKDELGKNIGDMTVSVWIDPNTDLPQKLSIDMTNMMKAVLAIGDDADSDEESAAEALSKVTVVYTNSEYDAVPEMELPEETKK